VVLTTSNAVGLAIFVTVVTTGPCVIIYPLKIPAVLLTSNCVGLEAEVMVREVPSLRTSIPAVVIGVGLL
jgi:hypothetical protein